MKTIPLTTTVLRCATVAFAIKALCLVANADVTLAADDFSEANGTLLHNKAADVGGNWNVTANNTVTIQGNAFDTDQAPGVRAFLSFGQALGAGKILRFEFTTLATTGTMFTTGGGFAGFSFFSGGSERIFVGDPGSLPADNSPQNWSLSGPSLGVTQTTINAEAVSGIFTYNFDTGAASLFVDDGTSTSTINFSYTAGLALDQIRIASGNGASEINVDSLSITALSQASILSFTASPSSFDSGESVTLSWDVADADSISIDQGIGSVAATGSVQATPTATTTWTLTATRGSSQVTAQATASFGKGVIDVYLLSGQSNMQGTARSSKLPAELLSIPEIRLYAAGTGVSATILNQWVDLQPAGGDTFGPEIGIGEQLRELSPGRPIALIKHAVGGNSLEIDFRPGANASDTGNWGPAFTAMVNTVNNGLAALEADGWQPVIRGMCWQQGEKDAREGVDLPESSDSAVNYGANLVHFIGRIREQFAAHASPAGIRFAPMDLPAGRPALPALLRVSDKGGVRRRASDDEGFVRKTPFPWSPEKGRHHPESLHDLCMERVRRRRHRRTDQRLGTHDARGDPRYVRGESLSDRGYRMDFTCHDI